MRFVRPASILLPLLLLAAITCEAQGVVVQGKNVYGVRSGDQAMEAAIDRARATLDIFNRYVERAARDGLDPRLKAAFRQGDRVEHMWVGGLTFDGRVYRGTLRNRPVDVTNVRLGDQVVIPPERVSDWSVVVDGALLGNFTTLVIHGRLTPKQRAQLEREVGARIVSDTALLTPPQP